jgi:hypothetical protein
VPLRSYFSPYRSSPDCATSLASSPSTGSSGGTGIEGMTPRRMTAGRPQKRHTGANSKVRHPEPSIEPAGGNDFRKTRVGHAGHARGIQENCHPRSTSVTFGYFSSLFSGPLRSPELRIPVLFFAVETSDRVKGGG